MCLLFIKWTQLFSIYLDQNLNIIALDFWNINFANIIDTWCHFHQVRAQLAPAVLSSAAGSNRNSASRSRASSRGAQKGGAGKVPCPPPPAPRLWYASASGGEPGSAQPPARFQAHTRAAVFSSM